MRSLGSSMTKFITAPLLGAGALALKTASDYEQLRTSMDALNGSVEEGQRNFDRLQRFSAGTPFQLQDLAQGQNMLQGFGMAADDAFDSLSMIGDIAAITGSDIQGIGVAFGQAAAEGKVMTRDIRQFINQGVPMVKMLSDTMGVAQSEIFDLASQGKISFDILQQAFRDATGEGGTFADGMQKQSTTIKGLFSTLKDNVSIALAEIGDTIVDTFNLREVIPAMIQRIQTGVEWFKNLGDEARKQLVRITAGIMAIGPAFMVVGTSIMAIGATIAALTSPIGLVIAAVGGLAASVAFVADNWEAVKERISDVSWWRNMVIDMMQFIIKNLHWRIWDGFNAIFKMIGGVTLANPFDPILDGLESLRADTKEYEHEFGSLRDAIINGASRLSGIDFRGLADIFTLPSGTGASIEREITKPLIEAKKPVDELIDTTDELGRSLADLSGAPAGSIAYMRDQISGLRDMMENATDPEHIRGFSEEIQNLQSRINELTGSGESSSQMFEFLNDIGMTFANSFGQGMANIVVQSEKFVDTLKNMKKLLASAIIQKGFTTLLTGGLGGAGFFGAGGGLLGSLFGGFRSNGGDVMAGRSYVVGENGREIFSPGTNGSITPVGQGSQLIRISLDNNMTLDGRVVFRNQRNIEHARSR